METIPLVAHQSAATIEGRLEGLVFFDDGNVDDNSLWTAQDTANALDQCPYEEYLGLKLYMEDPMSKIRHYALTTGADADTSPAQNKFMFIDHEFPVYPQAAILVEGELLRPGIITPSNCADFRNEGSESKRMKRIPHFITKAKNDWDWIRASSMNDRSSDGNTTISKSDESKNNSRRYEVFSSTNSIDPRNVIQGKVGNCGFCSIFASVVANWPEYIQNAFGLESLTCIHDCGAYSIQLFPQGRRRYLLLDDYILCHKNNVDDAAAAADGGDKMLYTSPSMHSLNENDLWIRLLEKAFVKLQGSIASLDGYYKLNSLYRHPGRALQLLTNASMALEIHYGRPEINDDNTNNDGTTINNTTEQEEEGEVFNTLQLTQGVCARVAHCRQTIHGLHSNHGYSLLWIGEVNVRRKIKSSSSSSSSSSSMEHIQHRLVCLRNPHGRGSYTGQDWGIDSSLWQEEEDVIQQLLIDNSCFMKCESTGRFTWQRRMSSGSDVVANMPTTTTTTVDLKRNADDDGIFFMSFSTFYNCFPIVTMVGPLSLSLCSDNSYHASSSIDDDDRLLLQQHDVPDCVHCVKGNLNCVREMIQKWL